LNLSPNLTVSEFIYSNRAIQNKIDNSVPQSLMPSARLCAERVFEPIRAILGGVPRTINSGYRNPKLNAITPGASATSQHMAASAIDVGMKPGENIFEAFLKLLTSETFVYDQLLIEGASAANPRSGWIHASWNSLKIRGKLDSGFDPNATQRMDVKIVTFDMEGRSATTSVTISQAVKWAEKKLVALRKDN